MKAIDNMTIDELDALMAENERKAKAKREAAKQNEKMAKAAKAAKERKKKAEAERAERELADALLSALRSYGLPDWYVRGMASNPPQVDKRTDGAVCTQWVLIPSKR